MKKIVILFDLAEQPPENQDYSDYIKDSAWDCEVSVKRAVQRLGHEAILVGVHNDISRLVKELEEIQPDLVFNLGESFKNKRELEAQLAGVIELMGIPHTGCPALSLSLCEDKALSKKILAHHRIRVPKWMTSFRNRPLKKFGKLSYPAFVKPINTEGSEGISKDSFVENDKDCADRVAFLHEKFQTDVIIEEFIPGKELYVSLIGGKRPKVFPFRELHFSKVPEDEPRFATYKTKWDEKYRKRWGIRNRQAKDLDSEIIEKGSRMVKRAFQVLKMNGYGRFDLRLTEDHDLVLIEANPNPSITDYDDFAMSAKHAGIEYTQLIEKIIHLPWSAD